MITFPNAKINVGLNIVEKRPDNYHNIESIFIPIPLRDILEIVESTDGETHLHLSGIVIDGDPMQNIVLKAYNLLNEEFHLPPVDIYLEKVIPFGAGLGGGSADAAFALKMLNALFSLNLTDEQLQQRAARIGADCAFFIANTPAYATGIGDALKPINIPFDNIHFTLVKPDVYVSTKEAYAHIKPQKPTVCVMDAIIQPIETWRENIKNDFEESVFPQHTVLPAIKEKLYEQGAVYAAMSGSGSSIFGLFKEKKNIEAMFPNCFVFSGEIVPSK